MRIYIYLDHEKIEKVAEPLLEAITEWSEQEDKPYTLVGTYLDEESEDDNIGLVFNVGKKAQLKSPLAFMYKQAQQYRCEFSLGILHLDDSREDVMFFGHEEGKPDSFEVANYLSL